MKIEQNVSSSSEKSNESSNQSDTPKKTNYNSKEVLTKSKVLKNQELKSSYNTKTEKKKNNSAGN